MASLTTRRSRVHAGNPAQFAPAPEQPKRWALRKAWFGLAHSATLSRTATALMDALWDRTNMEPLRDRRGMQPRYWLHEGVHVLKVWPSEETLAQELGCDQRTVRRAMKELTKRGLVERQRRSGGAPEHRSGPNRASVTLIRVPTPERMPAFRLRLHGTAADMAAAARRDPALAATLLTSTADTIDGILQQVAAGQRAWVERAKRMNREVLAMIVRLAHGGVGVVQAERGTLLTDAESLPTVQDTPARDNPRYEAEMTATVQDKSVLPYRTEMSCPSESLNRTLQEPNQGDGTQSTPAAGADEVGLVCFAGQTADPAEPSDPACPVESDATANASVEEHGWGESGPELADLTDEMIREAVAEWPNLAGYTHERVTMLNAFRKLRGFGPLRRRRVEVQDANAPEAVMSNDLIERMVSNRVRRETAEALYEQHQRDPERIRQACFDAERGVKEGTCRNPAGLIVSKLNKAAARASSEGGYSWAS